MISVFVCMISAVVWYLCVCTVWVIYLVRERFKVRQILNACYIRFSFLDTMVHTNFTKYTNFTDEESDELGQLLKRFFGTLAAVIVVGAIIIRYWLNR